jgi:hypothetical protein
VDRATVRRWPVEVELAVHLATLDDPVCRLSNPPLDEDADPNRDPAAPPERLRYWPSAAD